MKPVFSNSFFALAAGIVLVGGILWMAQKATAQTAGLWPYTLHITKTCPASSFTGAPGSYCTITASNVPAIKPGSKVFYDQGFGVPPGMLDSNVLLSVGPGDWATGRCTLDGNTGLGLCQFTDGVGQLAGFTARVKVSPFPDGTDFHWDGTYSFSPGLGQ